MAAKMILVLACVTIIAQLTMASPAQVLQTKTIEQGFQNFIGEISIADNNSVLACVSCTPIGACAGRCCNVPPYSICVNAGNQCYCK